MTTEYPTQNRTACVDTALLERVRAAVEVLEQIATNGLLLEQLPQADAIVLAVSHKEFAARPLADYQAKLTANGVLADVKAVFDPQAVRAAGIPFWRL